MHFDRLNEIYAIVKSNWHFEHFGLTSLTGGVKGQTGQATESAIWPITDQISWPCPSSQISHF
jgi:hypothetical protein